MVIRFRLSSSNLSASDFRNDVISFAGAVLAHRDMMRVFEEVARRE
jgi:hypothetical protein